jgi:dTDP-4-amino-4,6-dideoxygalactose transaminase
MFEIGEEEIQAVTDTLRRGILSRFQGGTEGYLAQAERDLAAKTSCQYALMMNSGTSALISSLVALGVGKGDEVLVSAYTWISTPLAPMLLQAVPVLVEVDDSLTMDPDDLARKISPRTKAIMVIHMGNRPCNMDRIMEIANAHHIPVVEDACQAVCGLYKGRRLGSIGKIGCFSFNNYKNITCGEGGAVMTDDDELFDRMRLWHDAGTFVQSYDAKVSVAHFAGQDYRASEIQGAIIWEQLKRLDPCMEMLRERVKLARQVIESVGKYKIAPHNDPESAVTLALQFESQEEFKAVAAEKGWNSIVSGTDRHIFTNWVPLVEKRAYRDDINPFLSEAGAEADFSAAAAPRTLDILNRSCYMSPAWNAPLAEVEKFYKDL